MDKLTKAERKEIRKEERQEWEAKLDKAEKMKVYKKAAIWIGAAIITILCGWGIISLINTSSPSVNDALTLPSLHADDISTGPKNAKVTLVEYADFQCPTCGLYHPILKKLQSDFNGKVNFVYRFFPLPTLHKNAIASAKAGYAANLQGKFWPMHDMLFEHQQDWAESNDARAIFTKYATQLGLNLDTFQKDFDAPSTSKFIDDEENAGTQAGVQGTPTFFLNGKSIVNPQGYPPFKQLLESKLKGK